MIDQKILSQFTRTEQWHRYNILMPNAPLTDGALYIAQAGGAFWLMDIIGSAQLDKKVQNEPFQVWALKVDQDNSKGLVTCEDGNGGEVYRQNIPFTDFELPEIELWASREDGNLIILLPSEY